MSSLVVPRKGARAHTSLAIPTAVTLLVQANPNRKSITFQNQGSDTVFLGASTVTSGGATRGYALFAGASFTDNASGQRTRSVDQAGFTINYVYDALGRLSQLLDGASNTIVGYTFDDIGRLQKKVNGNGTSTLATTPYTSIGGVPICAGTKYYGEQVGGGLGCTAFFIAPDMVATANHCLTHWGWTWDAWRTVLDFSLVSGGPAALPVSGTLLHR